MKNPIVIIVSVIFAITANPQFACGQSQDFSASEDRGRASSISEAAMSVDASDGDIIDYAKVSSRTAPAPEREITYDSDMPMPSKRTYYTTIELMTISWPEMMSQQGDDFGSKLIIGLNKPYYRLKKDIRVLGSFDLKLDNIFFGLTNSARITLKYDLKKPSHQGKSQAKVNIDGFAFKIGIPISVFVK
jgi:hypothetical protein